MLTTSVAKRLALNVLGDDDERFRGLDHRFEQRKQFLQAGQLFLVDQDIGVIHVHAHLVGVGDEVGGDIAAIELHALDHFEFGLQGFCFFDRDHALVADFFHRVGEELADFRIAVGGNRANLGDLFVRRDILRVLLQVRDYRFHREVDAALEVHRVHAGGDGLGAFLHDCLCENRGGRGAVTRKVGGLRSHFAHHLRAHILKLVFEFDLLSDRNAILGHARRAVRLVEHDVASLGAERYAHRVAENVHAAQHPVARID